MENILKDLHEYKEGSEKCIKQEYFVRDAEDNQVSDKYYSDYGKSIIGAS